MQPSLDAYDEKGGADSGQSTPEEPGTNARLTQESDATAALYMETVLRRRTEAYKQARNEPYQ